MARIARLHPMQVLLALLLALAAAGPAHAQQTTMDAAAAEMGKAISHAKAKTVIVFDFAGPGGKMTALGQKLADDFRAALAKLGGKFQMFQMEDESQAADLFRENDFTPGAIQDPETALWLAQKLDAGALIWGNVSVEGDEVKIALDCYRVDKGKKTGSFALQLALTDDMKALIDKSADADVWANIPDGGKNGYSVPTCIQCPEARFSNEAVKKKKQGTTSLEILIGEDGRTKDIKVLRALPYGLTEAAVEAVQSWEFKPANDPAGNPIEVKELVEVTFRLY